jgi:hypothetical protein
MEQPHPSRERSSRSHDKRILFDLVNFAPKQSNPTGS